MKCGIIGAGLAGLTCAGALRAAGYDVQLFDKGRGPGGRMSTRRMETPFGEARLDHGAPYFHAVGAGFRRAVEQWRQTGFVAPYPAAGKDAWIGMPSMSAVIAALAVDHRVEWATLVVGILRGAAGEWHLSTDRGLFGPFDTVVLAVPAEQAVPILALYDLGMAKSISASRSRACWAGLLVFEAEVGAAPCLRRGTSALSLALCNRNKPGRMGPEAWVVHASPEWSTAHLEHAAQDIAPLLLAGFKEFLGVQALPQCHAVAHRWRYAGADGLGQPALWNPDLRIGACGDWFLGPRAEDAWTSGRSLAGFIVRWDADETLLYSAPTIARNR